MCLQSRLSLFRRPGLCLPAGGLLRRRVPVGAMPPHALQVYNPLVGATPPHAFRRPPVGAMLPQAYRVPLPRPRVTISTCAFPVACRGELKTLTGCLVPIVVRPWKYSWAKRSIHHKVAATLLRLLLLWRVPHRRRWLVGATPPHAVKVLQRFPQPQ